MEYLTDNQLDEYRSILDKISEKFEELNLLEKEHNQNENKLVLCNLTASKSSQKLYNVNVKIFSDIVELFSLYRDEIPMNVNEFTSLEGFDFYFIEINFSQALVKYLSNLQWYVNIVVEFQNGRICSSVKGKNCDKITDVITLSSDLNSSICTVLYINISDTWMPFSLGENIEIDISHRISSTKIKSNNVKLLNIAKLYDKDNVIKSMPILNVPLPFDLDVDELLAAFIMNCYHNIDPNACVQFRNGSRKDFTFYVTNVPGAHSITITDKQLCLKAPVESLFLLKLHFYKNFISKYNFKKNNSVMKQIERLKNIRIETVEHAKEFYNAVRELIPMLLEKKID